MDFRDELASRIAVNETKSFIERNTSFDRVAFVCFDYRAYCCSPDSKENADISLTNKPF